MFFYCWDGAWRAARARLGFFEPRGSGVGGLRIAWGRHWADGGDESASASHFHGWGNFFCLIHLAVGFKKLDGDEERVEEWRVGE